MAWSLRPWPVGPSWDWEIRKKQDVSVVPGASRFSPGILHRTRWRPVWRCFCPILPIHLSTTWKISAEAFAKLQADPMYFGELSAFKPDDLPSTWRVAWEPSPLDFSLLEVWSEDAKRLPSVINVAYDPSTIRMIKGLRLEWYKVQMSLSLLGLGLALFTVLLLGRALFFTPLSSFQGKKLA